MAECAWRRIRELEADVAVAAIDHARRCVMRLHGGNPALDHLEAAMSEVENVARELRRHPDSDGTP